MRKDRHPPDFCDNWIYRIRKRAPEGALKFCNGENIRAGVLSFN